MRAFARDGILGNHLHFGFDGGAPGVGDFGVEDDEVANFDGFAEDERINGDGDDPPLGVAHTSQRARFVCQFHHPAAMHVAIIVGVFGLHQLGDADARGARGFWGGCFFHVNPGLRVLRRCLWCAGVLALRAVCLLLRIPSLA